MACPVIPLMVLLGSEWTNKGGIKASIHCSDNAEFLCEKGCRLNTCITSASYI